MRVRPTRHEDILWRALKQWGDFAPQVVIENFIADFAARDMMLAIEVDGASHLGSGKYRDRWRTEKLNNKGWVVIRFTNQEVATELSAVLSRIKAVCKQIWPTKYH
jgi:very-short-patch-repair endonuclease